MTFVAMLMALSLGLSGLGGLLSGIFASRLRWAIAGGLGFGLIDTVRFNVPSGSLIPVFLIIGAFWALAGWFGIGRWIRR